MPHTERPHGGTPVADGWSRPQLAALSGIAVVAMLLGWYLRQPDVMAGGDDIVYWLLGQSLATGHYHDLFLLGTPPHAKYPPGMPLWLAAVYTTGMGLPAVQLGQLVMLVMTALLVADALRRLQAPWLGVVAAAAIGWNPALLEVAGVMYSEMLFTLLFTLCLWALLRAEQSQNAREREVAIAVAIAVAAAAFLTRTAGLAVLATVPAVFAFHRRWRAAGFAALVGAILVVGWLAYVAHATQPRVTSYATDLSYAPLETTPGGLAGRALVNFQAYFVSIVPGTLGLPGIPHNPLDNLLWTIVLGGGTILGVMVCLRRWLAAPVMVLVYGAILLAWPWPLFRLALPLVPLVIPLVLLGASWPLSRQWTTVPRHLPLLGAIAVLGLGIAHGNVRRASDIAQCSRVDAWGVPSPCSPPRQRAMILTARAARSALPENSVIATSKDAVVYYHSGYHTIPFEELDYSLPSIVAAMEAASATHLLVSRINPVEERVTGPRALALCAELTEAIPSDGPAVLLAPRQGDDPDACAALRRVVEWQDPVE